MAAKVQPLDKWAAIAGSSLDRGATAVKAGGLHHGATTLKWDVAGSCSSPVYREILGARAESPPVTVGRNPFTERTDLLRAELHSSHRGPIHVIEMNVRCRRCAECLKARASHWRHRAEAEIAAASGRTWFGTLTLSPHNHWMAEARASLRLARSGCDWARLSSDEQFAERHRENSREITLWLKRVREQTGAKLRYICVAEQHKSGLPHYHLLIHEAECDKPVRHKTLKEQWRLGFSDFKLVAQQDEAGAARYVAKYLTKSASARVRASRGYGHAVQTPEGIANGGEREYSRATRIAARQFPTENAPREQQKAGKALQTAPKSVKPPLTLPTGDDHVPRYGRLHNATELPDSVEGGSATGGTDKTFETVPTAAEPRERKSPPSGQRQRPAPEAAPPAPSAAAAPGSPDARAIRARAAERMVSRLESRGTVRAAAAGRRDGVRLR